jgi:hypothetical protein
MNRPPLKSEAIRLTRTWSNSPGQTTVRTYCVDRQIANQILQDVQKIGIPADAIIVNAVRESNPPTEAKRQRGVQTSLLVGLPVGAVVGLTVALVSTQEASGGAASWNPWQYYLVLFSWSAICAVFFAGFAALVTFGFRKLSHNPASDKPGSTPYVVEVRCNADQIEKTQEICRRAGSTVRE